MDYASSLRQANADGKLSKAALDNILIWLSEPKYAPLRRDLEGMIASQDWKALDDNFFTIVPFGTGGRRGTVGIGSNRINAITMGESAQGLVDYLTQNSDAHRKNIVVAYDTRLTSDEFSKLVASIFAANGFTVHLFEGCRPTPELSFAVRHLHATAGVVVSASHNPPTDNGFKVYWTDGGQIVPPHDQGIMDAVSQVQTIATMDFARAQREGKIQVIGADVDEAYRQAVLGESVSSARTATLAYSPLHGTGMQSVLPILQRAGFTPTVVDEQATPDGRFPNVPNNIPNPEVQSASERVTELAQRLNADIGITTDPDADRLGTVARTRGGTYDFLNGNQIAFVLGAFVLEQCKSQGRLKPNHFLVKTIVTTDGLGALAKDYGVKIYDNILIGFKFVAELIRQNEGREEFLFGGEESHGILKGAYTRDKDAAIAALLMAELASTLKAQGRTVPDYLDSLYQKYGVFWEQLQNILYPGAEGGQKMTSIMAGLRQSPPTTVAGLPVLRVVDRLTDEAYNPKLPTNRQVVEGTKGDVLVYELSQDGRTRATVRPSGTEPKLKIYVQVHQDIGEGEATEALATAKQDAKKRADAIMADLAAQCS